MKIVVASVPGAGKSTVLKLVKKKIPSAKVVNVGDIIFEYAKKKYKIKNRDEMREKLSIEEQHRLQEVSAEKISKMKSKVILVDTHVSIETPHGYFPGLSEKTIHTMKPDTIVVLESRPEDVAERRKLDKSRKRDVETIQQIEEHQMANREFAFAAASHVEASVEIIDLRYRQKKPFEHAKKAANEIIKLIKS